MVYLKGDNEFLEETIKNGEFTYALAIARETGISVSKLENLAKLAQIIEGTRRQSNYESFNLEERMEITRSSLIMDMYSQVEKIKNRNGGEILTNYEGYTRKQIMALAKDRYEKFAENYPENKNIIELGKSVF